MKEFADRREKLVVNMENNSVAIFPAARTKYRNSDVEYPFRQNSDFYYLTGYSEPFAWLVIVKEGLQKFKYILFNLPHDPKVEVWAGKRVGQDDACLLYGADIAYDVHRINLIMPDLLANCNVIYYPEGMNKSIDLKVQQWNKHKAQTKSIFPFIHEMRLFKSKSEIVSLRNAASISAKAHNYLRAKTKPGMHEYQLQAIFEEQCLYHGCRNLAYGTIVASGPNATILHYVKNDKKINSNDLILIDAGGEYNYYAADITRTYPVSGKFNLRQKNLYSLVLEAQLAAIETVKPGNTWQDVEKVVQGILESGLKSLGFKENFRNYFMHKTGHWLGMDVHDVGSYKVDNQDRKFSANMVLTIEPGLYINELGIGIRIEDDILVTDTGNEVLSQLAAKSIYELESV